MAKVEPRLLYEPCACCGGFEVTAAADDASDYVSIIQRIGHLVYAGNEMPNDPQLLNQTATDILNQVREGYGRNAINIAYNTPDFRMVHHLEKSVYTFSAAKNYNQLKDMTSALITDGRLRTEVQFMEQIQKMNLKYNRDWLATERQTAIAGGQMASRWVEFEQNKEIMPMLQYSTVGDGKVRNSHRALDGIIKPVDDPFWDTYYPPNGWNCRCDVIQLPGVDITPTRDTGTPQIIAPMFETNLAKQGLIFPKEHPYFDGVPKAELRRAMAYLPPENSYMTVTGIQGKKIELHLLHNETELYKNLAVADDLNALGYKDIRLLPDIHNKEEALKARFYPKGYKPVNTNKNADALIRGRDGKDMVCEFKVLSGERNFATRVSEAAEQANYAIVKLNCTLKKLGTHNMQEIISAKLISHKQLKGVMILDRLGRLLFEQYR